jgi:hypothetical protein
MNRRVHDDVASLGGVFGSETRHPLVIHGHADQVTMKKIKVANPLEPYLASAAAHQPSRGNSPKWRESDICVVTTTGPLRR